MRDPEALIGPMFMLMLAVAIAGMSAITVTRIVADAYVETHGGTP